MLEKREVIEYFWRCDSCGATAPEGLTPSEAAEAAREVGWQCHTFWNGLDWVHGHYCPDCASVRLVGPPF